MAVMSTSTTQVVTHAAPAVDWQPMVRDKWAREYHAFQRLLPELLEKYRDQYVVIHEERVVDSGSDDLALALRFFESVADTQRIAGCKPAPGCIPAIAEADVIGAAERHYLRVGRPCRRPFPT